MSPSAVLWLPMVLEKSASKLAAVLWNPVLLKKSARQPVAAFPNPVVLLKSAVKPRAVLSIPLVTLKKCQGSLSRIAVRVASVRGRDNRLRARKKRKAGEKHRD